MLRASIINTKKGEKMTEEQEVREWMAWYLEKPINVYEVYGDALEFTAEEKAMITILRKAQEK
jgi:hypothetical protein